MMRRYYLSSKEFKRLVKKVFLKKGEVATLDWWQASNDIGEGLYKESEPFWLGSVYAKGKSKTGVGYARLLCDTEEDEDFLRALAEETKLDSGKLTLICADENPQGDGWPSSEVVFCYKDS